MLLPILSRYFMSIMSNPLGAHLVLNLDMNKTTCFHTVPYLHTHSFITCSYT